MRIKRYRLNPNLTQEDFVIDKYTQVLALVNNTVLVRDEGVSTEKYVLTVYYVTNPERPLGLQTSEVEIDKAVLPRLDNMATSKTYPEYLGILEDALVFYRIHI